MRGGAGRLLLAVATACLVTATACASAPSAHGHAKANPLAELDTAILHLNTARGAVLRDVATVARGIASLDTVDALSLRGDAAAVQARRRPVARAERAAGRAIARLGAHVGSYRRALAALRDAPTTALSLARRRVLRAVETAGQGEQSALADYAAVVRTRVWPAYRRLDAAVFTWADHATWGWFSSRRQAGDVYSVSRPASLQAARQRLAGVDRARARADAAMSTVLRRAGVELGRPS